MCYCMKETQPEHYERDQTQRKNKHINITLSNKKTDKSFDRNTGNLSTMKETQTQRKNTNIKITSTTIKSQKIL